jgi:hypothetical protein
MFVDLFHDVKSERSAIPNESSREACPVSRLKKIAACPNLMPAHSRLEFLLIDVMDGLRF